MADVDIPEDPQEAANFLEQQLHAANDRIWALEDENRELSDKLELARDNVRVLKRGYAEKLDVMQSKLDERDAQLQVNNEEIAARVREACAQELAGKDAEIAALNSVVAALTVTVETFKTHGCKSVIDAEHPLTVTHLEGERIFGGARSRLSTMNSSAARFASPAWGADMSPIAPSTQADKPTLHASMADANEKRSSTMSVAASAASAASTAAASLASIRDTASCSKGSPAHELGATAHNKENELQQQDLFSREQPLAPIRPPASTCEESSLSWGQDSRGGQMMSPAPQDARSAAVASPQHLNDLASPSPTPSPPRVGGDADNEDEELDQTHNDAVVGLESAYEMIKARLRASEVACLDVHACKICKQAFAFTGAHACTHGDMCECCAIGRISSAGERARAGDRGQDGHRRPACGRGARAGRGARQD